MKVAVVGAGIVGATAAYYLSKEKDCQLTVFDYGQGQATKAAAGIISPWFSKRRNKAWYKMARLGADFYINLIADLQTDGWDTSFYKQTGVCLLKRDETKLTELKALASNRREESPLIGQLAILSQKEVSARFPNLQGFDQLLYASGGARVEGASLTETLLAASGCQVIQDKVSLKTLADGTYQLAGQTFDQVLLATGAWLPEILEPLGYEVDIRPQKGQLRDYFFTDFRTDNLPVVMPEGELDIIPFKAGQVSVGASHENDQGYDLIPDAQILQELESQARVYLPILSRAKRHQERVGTRAYTSDFAPLYGQVPELTGVFAASGLGSSGLTTGPLIAKELVNLLVGKSGQLDKEDYPIERYICKKS
ncbi:glycine/D-amino acid oxidase [Streptococcus criceti]|uniref:Oxidoreductase, FAD-dependent n=2 Tax=Streptococcus criceti TaxID=1333 RepID=G5JQN7_STRCG|nr:FAD-dependent oxidoreductase [Streptococcus criceti]EHI74303.1 oxidoreductase, FAD-dependent [Streptococcus criceti HS-6]SUN43057.1 glycine/D-amino acid oxidase [Streptococcus criceti]BAE93255.2 putative oxidoreductase [Streptococcus criceti]BAM36166.1 putative oxidoreductase [Streptococcus criceti]BAM36168.1 putative oxidoreductase [Streptococcus criceti]